MRAISKDYSPALGDLRACGAGDVIWVQPSARERRDWARIVSAIADAVSRGAGVQWGVV